MSCRAFLVDMPWSVLVLLLLTSLCPGLVLDKARGIVLTDQRTVASTLSDIEVTVGGTVTIDGTCSCFPRPDVLLLNNLSHFTRNNCSHPCWPLSSHPTHNLTAVVILPAVHASCPPPPHGRSWRLVLAPAGELRSNSIRPCALEGY